MIVLAVSADSVTTRPKIPGFLKKHGLDLRVLLDDKKARKGYDVEGVPSLFVIDRKGFIAAVPSQFWVGDVKETLAEIVPPLLEGKPARGRTFLTLDVAPEGYGVLWQHPLAEAVADVAVAKELGNHPSEVAALSGDKLLRWTSSGDPLGSFGVREKSNKVRAEDLDGDGKRDWIVETENGFSIKDSEGEDYWGRIYPSGSPKIVGVQDLDGDGSKEIIVQQQDSFRALKANGRDLWRKEMPKDLSVVEPDPRGGMLVQTNGKTRHLDAEGKLGAPSRKVPPGRQLLGRVSLGADRYLNLYGSGFWYRAESRYDIDGDGRKDILISDTSSLSGYDADGKLLLTLRLGGGEQTMPWSAGDLDGVPGDEIVLQVSNYGLVALGRKTTSAPSAVTGR